MLNRVGWGSGAHASNSSICGVVNGVIVRPEMRQPSGVSR
ncbi:hypothetical protein JOF55_004146 [Haloactinomyces albus]|uniref:Uncharacterized protein n=1 Tax=Haloactinomyces albus TaxID=1352928 RepID=A0AAE3ZHW2_9ACTN|nr:hypothetical protein [Haloactinomyces albus]